MDESDGIARSTLPFRVQNFLPHILFLIASGEMLLNFSCRLDLYQIGHLHNLRSSYYKIFEF